MSCWVSLISSENPCGHRAPKLPASSTSVSITRRSTGWVIARSTRRSADRFDLAKYSATKTANRGLTSMAARSSRASTHCTTTSPIARAVSSCSDGSWRFGIAPAMSPYFKQLDRNLRPILANARRFHEAVQNKEQPMRRLALRIEGRSVRESDAPGRPAHRRNQRVDWHARGAQFDVKYPGHLFPIFRI